jgi:hypothetical protein
MKKKTKQAAKKARRPASKAKGRKVVKKPRKKAGPLRDGGGATGPPH